MTEPFFKANKAWLRLLGAFAVATGATVGAVGVISPTDDQPADTTSVPILAPARSVPAETIEEVAAAFPDGGGGGRGGGGGSGGGQGSYPHPASPIELPPDIVEAFETPQDSDAGKQRGDGTRFVAPSGVIPDASEAFGFEDPCINLSGGCPSGEGATVLGGDTPSGDVHLSSVVFEIRAGPAALRDARCTFTFDDPSAVPLLVITTNPGEFRATYGPRGGAPSPDAPHDFATADAQRTEWRRWERSGRPVLDDEVPIEGNSFVHTCTTLPGSAVAPGESTDWEVTVDGTFPDTTGSRTTSFLALVLDPDGGPTRPAISVTPTDWGFARVTVPVDTSNHEEVRVAFVAIPDDADPGGAACAAAAEGDFATFDVTPVPGDRADPAGFPEEIPVAIRESDGYPYAADYDAVIDVASPALNLGRPHEVCIQWTEGGGVAEEVAVRVTTPNAIVWGIVLNFLEFGDEPGRPEDVEIRVGALVGVSCEYALEGSDPTGRYEFESPGVTEPCVGDTVGRPGGGPRFGRPGHVTLGALVRYLGEERFTLVTYTAATCDAPAVCGTASEHVLEGAVGPGSRLSFSLWTYAQGVPPAGSNWIVSGERGW